MSLAGGSRCSACIFLIAEGEPPEAREERRQSVGRSSGETYADLLAALSPGAEIVRIKPADGDRRAPGAAALFDHDAIFLTGSPLHLWKETPQARRQVAFMREVFAAGTPAFGSCAGLQVACVAAGGTVRPMTTLESGFARRISPTDAGLTHPLLAGRPRAYDAPAVHADEVERLPDGATLLASNAVTLVQAAEIRADKGVFWGTQYHPEISLGEVAAALRRQADDLVAQGFSKSPDGLEAHLGLIDDLDRDPSRRDLAWRLGLDSQVTDLCLRTRELRNFLDSLVHEVRRHRGRG